MLNSHYAKTLLKNFCTQSSLSRAVVDRDLQAVEFHLAQGILPNSFVLSSVGFKCDREILDLFLKYCVPLSPIILQHTIRAGNIELADHLMDSGVQANKGCLISAARYGHKDLVKRLLFQGVEASSEALLAGVRSGNLEVVKLLAETGLYVPNAIMIEACKSHNTEIVKYLCSKGGPLSDECLNSALKCCRYATADFLLSEGIKPNLVALSIAIESGPVDLLSKLIDHGAEVSSTVKGLAGLSDKSEIKEYFNLTA